MLFILFRFILLSTFGIFALCPVSIAQTLQSPLEMCSFKKVTSHDQMVSYLHQVAAVDSRITIDSIGATAQGRMIPLVHVAPQSKEEPLRVLIFCQQHGDEPSGKEAVLILLHKIAQGQLSNEIANLDISIIPSVNPDGNESKKRRNGNGKDLNRDHLMLLQPETQAVHRTFHFLNPLVTLDVHEFAPYRKSFVAAGYIRAVDQQCGAPTNLNIPTSISDYGVKQLFPFMEKDLNEKGFQFCNYIKTDAPDDTVRTSTTSINDGRQSLAILNTFSFIFEGKNGKNFNDDLQRRTMGQLTAMESFLHFVNDRRGEIRTIVLAERKRLEESTDSVIVQMDYMCTGEKITVPMKLIATNKDTVISMNYASEIKVMKTVQRPAAYIVPGNNGSIIELLNRHGIQYEKISTPTAYTVEVNTITDVVPSWIESKPFYEITTQVRTKTITTQPGDIFVPLHQRASSMLVIALEPTSMWGIIQEGLFAALRSKGSEYPVYRVMK